MMASVDLVSSQSVGFIRIVFCLLLLETLFVFFSFLSLYKKMMVAWFHSFLSSGCSKRSSRLFPYSIDPPFSLFYFLTHSQLEIFTQLRPAQVSSNQPTPLGPWFFFILAECTRCALSASSCRVSWSVSSYSLLSTRLRLRLRRLDAVVPFFFNFFSLRL